MLSESQERMLSCSEDGAAARAGRFAKWELDCAVTDG